MKSKKTILCELMLIILSMSSVSCSSDGVDSNGDL